LAKKEWVDKYEFLKIDMDAMKEKMQEDQENHEKELRMAKSRSKTLVVEGDNHSDDEEITDGVGGEGEGSHTVKADSNDGGEEGTGEYGEGEGGQLYSKSGGSKSNRSKAKMKSKSLSKQSKGSHVRSVSRSRMNDITHPSIANLNMS